MSKVDGATDLIKPVIIKMGYIFWGLKFSSMGKKTLLQIFIDHQNGVSLSDCEKVAIQVSTLLDVEDPIRGKYELEISSPGIYRELFTLSQCEKYINQNVRVCLFHKLNNRRKFNAKIIKTDLENEKIELVDEMKDRVEIDFSLIQKIKLTG